MAENVPIWKTDAGAASEEAERRLGRNFGLLFGSSLDLSDITALAKLPSLEKQKELKELNLSGTKVVDITAIGSAPLLEKFIATRTPLVDASPLASITGLKEVRLDHTPIQNVGFLASCSALTKISLWGTNVSNIDFASKLQELDHLTLWQTPVTDLSPIIGLPKLRYLDLEGTRFESLLPILSLPSLKVLYVNDTALADYAWVSELPMLTTLGLSKNPSVNELAFLSELRDLETLILKQTNVSDISPLAKLEGLVTLNLSETKVTDIGVLRGLKSLEYLNISNTQVSNLIPLARSLSLLKTVSKNPTGRGLEFLNCPVGDLTLSGFSKLKNPERTLGTLNYLREKIGLLPVDGTDINVASEINAATSSLEQLFENLQQDRLGARSIRIGHQFALAPSGDQSDASVADDPIAQQLHRENQRKLPALSELANRVRNQPGWSDLASTVVAFKRIAELPLSEIAERPAELWSICASLGAYAEQHSSAERNPASFVMPLEADGVRVMTDSVATAAVLARRFLSVRILDEELRLFHALPEPIEAASRLVLAAAQQSVLVAESASLVIAELSAPTTVGPQSQKAHGRGLLSARNLALAAVGAILTGYLAEFGAGVARDDILLQRAKNWILAKEAELIETFDGASPDTQAALREALRRANLDKNEGKILDEKIKREN